MLQKTHPGVGWVRADLVPSQDATLEILKLRTRIEDLEMEISETQTEAPKGTDKLAQGDEKFQINCTFESTGPDEKTYSWNWYTKSTWNKIFSEVSPLMLHEATTDQLKNRLSTYASEPVASEVKKHKDYTGHKRLRNVKVDQSCFETIIIQISALGLISQSGKNRSVKDSGTYWTLTPYGVTVMNRLRAVMKEV